MYQKSLKIHVFGENKGLMGKNAIRGLQLAIFYYKILEYTFEKILLRGDKI